jgi:hypothetical protein
MLDASTPESHLLVVLWADQNTMRGIIEMTPFRLIMGQEVVLLVELEVLIQ